VLFHWFATPANRVTVDDEWFTGDDDRMLHFDPLIEPGVLIGYWDEAELAEQHEARRRWLARRSAD